MEARLGFDFTSAHITRSSPRIIASERVDLGCDVLPTATSSRLNRSHIALTPLEFLRAHPPDTVRKCSAFRELPYAGVVQVAAEAARFGYTNGDPQWCNLGQGQPDVGPIDGAPERIDTMDVAPDDQVYGPVAGMHSLRRAVAEYYNRLFRGNHRSKYRAENVAIAAGGRLTLSRLMTALGSTRLGYRTPDYAGYNDLLAHHSHRLTLIPVPTFADEGFMTPLARFSQLVADERLGAYLISNPCNPTGQLLQGAELEGYVDIASVSSCALLIDEFYSHFIYAPDGSPGAGPVSASRYVHDVDRDPVLIVDGLTKNFRYPGWRIGWVVGPADIIEQVVRAASCIDGGAPTMVQRAALKVLQPARADQETRAVRQVFARKREVLLAGLTRLGVRVPHAPRGTFYIWGDISALTTPFNDAEAFFRRALEHRIMLVPGRSFDINPDGHRPANPELDHWVRFSFGPPEENLRLGLSRLGQLLPRLQSVTT